MTDTPPGRPTSRGPLHLRIGVRAAVLLVLLWFVLPAVAPEAGVWGVAGGLICTLTILAWWLFFSGRAWSERLGAVAVMIVGMLTTSLVLHKSISGGMMGMMFPLYASPVVMVALVAWAAASRHLADGSRRAAMVITLLMACGAWTLLRTDGVTGEGNAQLKWRWTSTAEERLLASGVSPSLPETKTVSLEESPVLPDDHQEADPPALPAAAGTPTTPPGVTAEAGHDPSALPATPARSDTMAVWPGFRGTARNGSIDGVRIATDWSASPPVELWRRPVGPGWSSFAVRGDLVYTHEQRGDDEVVTAYDATTGAPVWRHSDPVRFWESNGGAGPRATPTLGRDRVFTFGATGILNALDVDTGAVAWSRDVASDTAATIPDWGFSSSPLVLGDVVIVFARTLAAYDVDTGDARWFGPAWGGSYSSPQFVTLDGIQQVLMMSGQGATSVDPRDGTLLWQHSWEGTPIVQPAVSVDGDVLISTASMTGGIGTRRLHVAQDAVGQPRRDAGTWTVEERWTSRGLKPYFNDFVVHRGYAYGFDGSILACIDLESGERRWKGGRYGHGQIVLLPDEDMLLVLSEEGELALVGATSDQFSELARFSALDGKTWNHPVLVGDVLLVRNGEEMAAFRLALDVR